MATSFEDFTGVTQRQQGPVARRVGVTGRARETVGRETTIIDPGDPSPDAIPFGPAGAIRERQVEGTPDRFVRGAGPPAPATARTRDGRIVPAAGPPTPAGTFIPGRPGGTVTDVI